MDVRTSYTTSGGVSVAYQVAGHGPPDVLFLPEWFTNLEIQWEEPRLARVPRRLASFSRLVMFNQRGIGLSDPIPIQSSPTAEEWIDDARAVMDAVGVERAAVLGTGIGGTVALLFAASHPDRVTALVVVNSTARTAADDDYPFGSTPEQRAGMRELMRTEWGRAAILRMLAPDLAADERFRDWYGRFERLAASPGMALAAQRLIFDLDVRHVLPAIRCPTLVIHRSGDPLITVEHGRYLARALPGARYVELPGDGHAFWSGDTDALLDEIETFLTPVQATAATDRVVATVLFTDIVGSTALASQLGDSRWTALLAEHDLTVRREVERARGRVIENLGDGFLATFDGPARAIRCACAVRDALRPLGLEIRAGLHTGEIHVRGADVSGLGVHIGARVAALAQAGEILVSRTVVDLVAGSGIPFESRGTHTLKGVHEPWQLYAVAA